MDHTVTLQSWQFNLLFILSLYAIFQLVILPLIQRYIYNRTIAVERRLDEELELGLPSYALASRRLWIDRLLNDPEIIRAIQAAAEKDNVPVELALKRAKKYASEMVPSFNALAYFRVGYWLARWVLRLFYSLQSGLASSDDYSSLPRDATIVMVSNHRSNIDAMIMVYMTSKRAPISYAAGEWALVTPLRQIFHAVGSYIIRRNSGGNPLYRTVLERYAYLVGSQCVPQGLFLEGALTRDGRMQPLKLGMLSYLLKADQEGNCKDIIFIPAGLNYDKVPEDRTLLAYQEEGFQQKGRLYSLLGALRFFGAIVTYMMPRRRKPFGYACVNFGKPISLKQWQQENGLIIREQQGEDRKQSVSRLGDYLSGSIQKIIPVLPTHVLAEVINSSSDMPLSEFSLKLRASKLIERLKSNKASVFLPDNDEDFALSQGVYILIKRNVIAPTGDGRFKLVEGNRKLLEYYCNTVANFLDNPLSGEDELDHSVAKPEI